MARERHIIEAVHEGAETSKFGLGRTEVVVESTVFVGLRELKRHHFLGCGGGVRTSLWSIPPFASAPSGV